MKNLKENKLITVGIIIIVVALFTFLANFIVGSRIDLRDQIYSEFTCTCCEGSLLDASDSCYMGGGMKRYIDDIMMNTIYKDEVMLRSVKKFGIPNLVKDENKAKYLVEFVKNKHEDIPKLVVRPEQIDLGIVSNSKGIIISDFKIKNNGTEDLIINDLKTSCSCLTASFIKDGKETVRVGRFSHSEGWTFVLEPEEDGLIRTYYDPRVTNWQTGHVERIITITSNDPTFFNKIIKISADLVP